MKYFSVLMSVYYGESHEYLAQCLESLSVQTFPASEIVIVKDGKLTNELENVLLLWKEKLPIKLEGYEENKGLAYALNYGLQFCSYALIARMDGDDVSMPDRFEKQIEFFEQNNDVVAVGASILEFYSKDEIKYIGKRDYPIRTDRSSISLFKGTPIAHPVAMIKADVLKEYRYRTDVISNEDIDLWFRLISDGHFIENINEPLLKYRITDKTFLRRNSIKAWSEFKIYYNNLVKLHGFSRLLIFPLLRFIFRLLPQKAIKKIYFSAKRYKLLI